MEKITSKTTTTGGEASIADSNALVELAFPQSFLIDIGAAEVLLTLAVMLFAGGAAWGRLKKAVSDTHTRVARLEPRIANVERKIGLMWEERLASAASPRQLTRRGEEIRDHSGIKVIVDEQKDWILAWVKETNPTTAYDAEKAVLQALDELPRREPDIAELLKQKAYAVGANMDEILFVGGIYARDLIFPALGFALSRPAKGRRRSYRRAKSASGSV